MSQPAIIVKDLSKSYRLGVIGRQTLQDEIRYWWHKVRGRNPLEYMGKIGQPATSNQHPVPSTQYPVPSNYDSNTFWALKDISFTVQPGEVLGIIGRNAAGKTTLLKILTRITEPTSGTAIINGRVASLLEVGTGFHPELTGRENIFLNGSILGMKQAEIANKFDEIVGFAEIHQFIDTPVKRYSSGMYVRLAFAVAAHLDPEILLIDEVLAVGDVEFQKKCLGKMKDVAGQGRTVLFVSHNMSAIRNLCERTLLIGGGRIILDAETSHSIAKYLDRNLLEGAIASKSQIEQRMEGQINRRNPTVRFQEIAICDKSGSPRNSFNSDEDITVSVIFKCMRPVQNLYILVDVVDENNNSILSTCNVDDSDLTAKFYRLEPDVYNASCDLPKNTFGGRNFFLTVCLINLKTEHLAVKKILEFEVKFQGYGGVPGQAGNAFIRPHLKWSMRLVNREKLINHNINQACVMGEN